MDMLLITKLYYTGYGGGRGGGRGGGGWSRGGGGGGGGGRSGEYGGFVFKHYWFILYMTRVLKTMV